MCAGKILIFLDVLGDISMIYILHFLLTKRNIPWPRGTFNVPSIKLSS